LFENQKKKKIWKYKKYLHKYPSKRHKIQSLLRRADARGRADIIYRIDAYRYFAGQAQLLRSESRLRIA